MTPLELKTIEELIAGVKELSVRVQKLEESVNLGRGGLKTLLILSGVLGTILGALRFFGR